MAHVFLGGIVVFACHLANRYSFYFVVCYIFVICAHSKNVVCRVPDRNKAHGKEPDSRSVCGGSYISIRGTRVNACNTVIVVSGANSKVLLPKGAYMWRRAQEQAMRIRVG